MVNELTARELFGDKAVCGVSRLFLRAQHDQKGAKLTFIGGVLATKTHPLGEDRPRQDELWECDVVIIPRRKLTGHCFIGVRAGEVMDKPFAEELYWDDEISSSGEKIPLL